MAEEDWPYVRNVDFPKPFQCFLLNVTVWQLRPGGDMLNKVIFIRVWAVSPHPCLGHANLLY